jgi:hypothetical protein
MKPKTREYRPGPDSPQTQVEAKLSPSMQQQVRELTDEHSIVELRDQLAASEREVQILRERAAEFEHLYTSRVQRIAELEAKLLQADDVIAELREEQYGPTTDEIRAMGHAEAVELADAMIAPAGFELLRDDGAAMWIQHLKDARPGVQVFFTIPEGILAAGPANVFAFVKANVGVAQ